MTAKKSVYYKNGGGGRTRTPSVELAASDFQELHYSRKYDGTAEVWNCVTSGVVEIEDHFNELLVAMEDEIRQPLRDDFSKRYDSGIFRRIWRSVFRRRYSLADAVFYRSRRDGKAAGMFESYAGLFALRQRTAVCETKFRKLIQRIENSPLAIFHCLSPIEKCPIATGKVQVAVFDSPNSEGLASQASCFTRYAYGFEGAYCSSEDRHYFFNCFYKKVLNGAPVGGSYKDVMGYISYPPKQFEGLDVDGCDLILFPISKNTEKYRGVC